MKVLIPFLILFFAFSNNAFSEDRKGYIITLDAQKITGSFSNIYYSRYGVKVTFTNDMGSKYDLIPIRIQGFAMFKEDGGVEFYESKYHKRVWYFLKVVHKGKVLSLYRSPAYKYVQGSAFEGYLVLKQPSTEKWLEFTEKEKLFRVYGLSFRKN